MAQSVVDTYIDSDKLKLWIGGIPKEAHIKQVMGALNNQGFRAHNYIKLTSTKNSKYQWIILEVQDIQTKQKALRKGIKYGPKELKVKEFDANKRNDKAIFNGIAFLLSGNFTMKQSDLETLIIQKGGEISKHPDYIIIKNRDSNINNKCKQAMLNPKIKFLKEKYIQDSIAANRSMDIAKYEIDPSSLTKKDGDRHKKMNNQNQKIEDLDEKQFEQEYNELFLNKIMQKILMMFFDAKLVKSDSVKHEVYGKSNTMKRINFALKFAEKLAKPVPILKQVIGLFSGGIEAGYDQLVLQSLAAHVLNFESTLNNNISRFASRFALKITKEHLEQIAEIRCSKEIEELATKLADNLYEIISTGYAKKVYAECLRNDNDSYLDILVVCSIYSELILSEISQPKNIDKKKWLKVVGGNIVSSYFETYGTKIFIDNLTETAKQYLNK